MNTDGISRRGRFLAGALACTALLVTAGTVFAGTITGTAGNDNLAGTAKADKLVGRGGNDRLAGRGGNDVLLGGAGNDVLSGGVGNDLLVGGPGKDTLACGSGKDVARADRLDRVSRDCEVVTGIAEVAPPPPAPPPPAPAPPPPPPPTQAPVTAGSYQGQTQNGNYVFFTLTSSRAITGFRVNDLPDPCQPGGTLSGGEDFGDSTFPVGDDGTFDAAGKWDGSQVYGDIELTHWDGRITGRFDTATTANGTILMDYEFNYQGTHYTCSSGSITWSVTHQG